MNNDGSIEDELKAFLLEEFLDAGSSATLTRDTPLLTTGVLDSVGTLTLVAFMEERFSISIQAHEADVDNLNTIADMARLVRRKQEEGA